MDVRIAVLGLGESLKLFNAEEFDMCIGVNDIWRYIQTDVVVVLDKPSVFTPDRLKVINECKPEAFFSQMVVWDTRKDFNKIDFIPGYPDTFCQLNSIAYQKSFCSPFVAAQIAWKRYYATEIHLFGVDLVNHPHLDRNISAKIKVHFQNLKAAFIGKHVDLYVHGHGILTTLL